jgi:hypothetical protein
MKGLKCLISGKWWNAAGTRALKTAAQSAVATIAVKTIFDVEWIALGGIVLLSAFLSLLTSLAGIPEIDGESDASK